MSKFLITNVVALSVAYYVAQQRDVAMACVAYVAVHVVLFALGQLFKGPQQNSNDHRGH
jgi:hypothetical protein